MKRFVFVTIDTDRTDDEEIGQDIATLLANGGYAAQATVIESRTRAYFRTGEVWGEIIRRPE